MRVGVLTGGGDCPGLNPAIRGLVLRGLDHGFQFVGLELGWKGLVDGLPTELTLERVEEIIRQGGTILGSSRTNPFKDDLDPLPAQKCLENWRKLELDALVALGGEDTLGVANKFHLRHGLSVVGVPKTMDNDLNATDYTFGFDSAATVAMEAADRLFDTAKSHRRILILEVMGRHAGWVALQVGVAAGADWICLPEIPLDFPAMIAALRRKLERGKRWGLIVASEGTDTGAVDTEDLKVIDDFGHVSLAKREVGRFLEEEIKNALGIETRSVVLGHVQRGGPPSLFDRVLGTRVGIKAADMVRDREFGQMAALRGTEIVAVDLAHAVGTLKTVPPALWQEVVSLINK
ncbi:MAG: ATP-dependent 6-phosphofructokinase [Armatimonadetes bacterium]|nr:ATP-dependent 6-phosphofructokinase [Armatimonadota bacterium]